MYKTPLEFNQAKTAAVIPFLRRDGGEDPVFPGRGFKRRIRKPGVCMRGLESIGSLTVPVQNRTVA
jgi:hypothetical protein